MGFFETVGSRLGSKLATTTPEEASKKLTGVDPIGNAALGMVRGYTTPDVAPEPIKTSTPSDFATDPAQESQGPAPMPIYIPPTYGRVGTGKYQPRTRVTEGQYLPEMQIGTDVKYTAVDPRDADDANIVDYEWQNMGAAGAPFVSPELNPTGRPQAEIIAEMSTKEGYIDPNGFVWKLQADENGNPQYLKGRPIVKTETPIMGTATDAAIIAGDREAVASQGSLEAQRDLELATIQANQNQVNKRREVEDELLEKERKRNTNLEIANSHYSQLVSELEDNKVNPSRQFQKLTPAGRMARVVYLFTAGMRGPEYLKLAMDQLNADVERDIDAQKQAINAKKDRVNGQLQIIKNMRDQFDTERNADNAISAVTWRRLEEDAETELAGIKNVAIRAKAEEAIAAVRARRAEKEMGIEMSVAPTVKEAEDFDTERVVQTSPGRYVVPPGSDPIQNLQNEAASILANPNRTSKDQARYDWIMKALAGSKDEGPKKTKAQEAAENALGDVAAARVLLDTLESLANKPNKTADDWYAWDAAAQTYTQIYSRIGSPEALSEAQLKSGKVSLPNPATFTSRNLGNGSRARAAVAGARVSLSALEAAQRAKAGQAPPRSGPPL